MLFWAIVIRKHFFLVFANLCIVRSEVHEALWYQRSCTQWFRRVTYYKVVSLSHLIDFFVPFLDIFPARVTTFCIRGLVFLGISGFREERDTPGVLQSSLSGAEVVYVWQNKDLHLLQVCTENATCETELFSVKIADEQSL